MEIQNHAETHMHFTFLIITPVPLVPETRRPDIWNARKILIFIKKKFNAKSCKLAVRVLGANSKKRLL